MNIRCILFLASFLLVAGCLSQPSPEDDGITSVSSTLNPEEACTSDRTLCAITPHGWLIEDVEIRNDEGAKVGILLGALDRPLTLRNISVTGFAVAIHVQCNACTPTIIMENVTLDGGGDGEVGIDYRLPPGMRSGVQFHVSNMTIKGFELGIGWFGDPEDDLTFEQLTVECHLEGAVVSAGEVHLHGGEVRGCDGSGARLKGYSFASIQELVFRQNGQGASLFGQPGSHATIEGTRFQDSRVGGLIAGTGSISVQGNVFRGNGAAMSMPDTAIEANRVHALFVNSATTDVHGNCFGRNSGWAITGSLAVAPIVISGNSWAGEVGPLPTASDAGTPARPIRPPGFEVELVDEFVLVRDPNVVAAC